MSNLILGTAGHIDHGKTSLVRALTGIDTDRLKEEKERGITIELGFAELAVDDHHFGVVDVPGHEAFVRAMVAGAAGMDVVLLVVAADEGIMPQTREHLSIVELLGVPELVVALTKCDLVDAEWLELVESEVMETLQGSPWEDAVQIPTSATTEEGIDALRTALAQAASRSSRVGEDDLVRLPLDRVFTIQGTGTVVTGTLWTGTLRKGDRVRILPDDLEARVRGLQVHGREVDSAVAGDRTAVALTGDGADRDIVARGATLTTERGWTPTWMITARVRMLPGTAWSLAHNQRIRVHVGTAEVMARCALLEAEPIAPGQAGWVQLRLEEPVVARGGDRLVLRAYSPVTTIGGGHVAEPTPPKRNRLDEGTRETLEALVDGDAAQRIQSALDLASWSGIDPAGLTLAAGVSPAQLQALTAEASGGGNLRGGDTWYAPGIRRQAEARVLKAVRAEHERDPLRPAIPMAAARAALPEWAGRTLPDAVIDALIGRGDLERVDGGVRAAGHAVDPTPEQRAAADELRAMFRSAELAAPLVEEVPDPLGARPDLWSILKYLESSGELICVADNYYVDQQVLSQAIARVREELGGRSDLGPADFREALPVTRKHLIPLLNHLDAEGVTVRRGDTREVPA